MGNKVITVFEHSRLKVDETYGTEEVCFTEKHFIALVRYNEAHDNRFFTVEHRKVKFSQHVGVIAVPGLIIEVLPKPDGNDDKAKWQQALIAMLKVAHGLPLHEAGHAQLALRRTSVLEYFLRLYVEEVRRLVHQGLVKRYRQKAGVSNALKGRLDLPRHLRNTVVHKERFHVIHQAYDTDHLLHAILKKGLDVVENVTRDPITMGLAQDMLWAFEDVADRPINGQTFERLFVDRKTRGYTDALQLAKLLLLNYAPDIKGGREHILSLLFDMNKLFEVVVLKLLKRAASNRPELSIKGQNSREFWNGQHIRPDIIIAEGEQIKCIIDTKWKLPKDDKPADSDLKQMYAYNLQFGSDTSVLLYPGDPFRSLPMKDYTHGARVQVPHGCSIRFIHLFDAKGGIQLNDLHTLLGNLVPLTY